MSDCSSKTRAIAAVVPEGGEAFPLTGGPIVVTCLPG